MNNWNGIGRLGAPYNKPMDPKIDCYPAIYGLDNHEDFIDIVTNSGHLIELEFRPLCYWGSYRLGYEDDGGSHYLELGFMRVGVRYS